MLKFVISSRTRLKKLPLFPEVGIFHELYKNDVLKHYFTITLEDITTSL